MAWIDLSGTRLGRLVPFEYTLVVLSSGRKMSAWKCRCDCGKEITALTVNLRKSGHTTSCGCFVRENRGASQRTHGASTTRPYRVYRSMLNRCYEEWDYHFKWYGARGIMVCDRWRFGEGGKTGFDCWQEDMGPKPTPKHTLDRQDNGGNYEPGNCRWATMREQAANTRRAGHSGVVGVSPDHIRGGWRAHISGRSLGRFIQFEDAVAARRAAEI